MVDETTGDKKVADAASSGTLSAGDTPVAPTGAPQDIAGAPVLMQPVPTPATAPTATATPNTGETNIGSDIAKILKDVKLPERRDVALSAEKKPAAETKDINALLSDTPASTAAAPEPAPAAPPKDAVQSMHTLRQDLQQVVRDQKISTVRAAALEQDRHRPPQQEEPPRPSRAKNGILAALVLLFLGAAALGGVYIVVQDRTEPLPQVPTDSLVFAEQTVSLALDGQSSIQLKNLLAEARGASSASLGSITRIAPVKTETTVDGEATRLATLSEFFGAIGVIPPSELIRALSQEFFFGLHTVDKNAPLLVIPVLSYDRAFAGMLAWESSLNADLAPIYTRVPDVALNPAGTIERRAFSDVVMRNYDVRALTDDSGEVIMYYSFPTRDVLIIAESPYTFTELLSRLQAQKNL